MMIEAQLKQLYKQKQKELVDIRKYFIKYDNHYDLETIDRLEAQVKVIEHILEAK